MAGFEYPTDQNGAACAEKAGAPPLAKDEELV
jgi:hypothetical protein